MRTPRGSAARPGVWAIVLLPTADGDLPVNVFVIVGTIGALVLRAVRIGLERHHVVIFGTLLVAGALPVWSGVNAVHAACLLTGLAIILNGILDHRLLVREFGPARAPALGNGDARA
jgi:hypothetical protein